TAHCEAAGASDDFVSSESSAGAHAAATENRSARGTASRVRFMNRILRRRLTVAPHASAPSRSHSCPPAPALTFVNLRPAVGAAEGHGVTKVADLGGRAPAPGPLAYALRCICGPVRSIVLAWPSTTRSSCRCTSGPPAAT